MNEFKDQLDATEKDKVTTLVTELRELASKGQSGDPSIDAEKIKAKISETQQASLGLFQKASFMYFSPMYIYLSSLSRFTKSGVRNRIITTVKIPRRIRRRRRKTNK